jgi:hypothetical protein
MGAVQRFAPAPPAAVSRVLRTFGRAELEGFIAVAIDLLDLADGNPDAEEETLEDAFVEHHPTNALYFADSEGGAYIEWHTIPARFRRTRTTCRTPGQEDDETTGAEDDFHPERGYFRSPLKGAGCPISDPDEAVDDKPCDDQFEDREQEVGIRVPTYGVDQTTGPIDRL